MVINIVPIKMSECIDTLVTAPSLAERMKNMTAEYSSLLRKCQASSSNADVSDANKELMAVMYEKTVLKLKRIQGDLITLHSCIPQTACIPSVCDCTQCANVNYIRQEIVTHLDIIERGVFELEKIIAALGGINHNSRHSSFRKKSGSNSFKYYPEKRQLLEHSEFLSRIRKWRYRLLAPKLTKQMTLSCFQKILTDNRTRTRILTERIRADESIPRSSYCENSNISTQNCLCGPCMDKAIRKRSRAEYLQVLQDHFEVLQKIVSTLERYAKH